MGLLSQMARIDSCYEGVYFFVSTIIIDDNNACLYTEFYFPRE